MYALENFVIVLRTGEEAFIERLHHYVTITNGWKSQSIIIKDQVVDV